MNIKVLLEVFRLRTLPLALASTLMGSFLAIEKGVFRIEILILSALTTLLLQILSNLANDYGDTQHGADNAMRVGPERAMQKGSIGKKQMQLLIGIFTALSFVSGSWLIFLGLQDPVHIAIFYLLGGLAIWAAIKYTVGKNPYGYAGLGDVFVFLFFGLIGVLGTFYLHSHSINGRLLLPAAALGFFSAGVLNLNNMRDRENDANSGKNTLVVRMGSHGAKVYHSTLLILAWACSLFYSLICLKSILELLYLIILPLFILHGMVVIKDNTPAELNQELKKLAIFTFLYSVTFGLGTILG